MYKQVHQQNINGQFSFLKIAKRPHHQIYFLIVIKLFFNDCFKGR